MTNVCYHGEAGSVAAFALEELKRYLGSAGEAFQGPDCIHLGVWYARERFAREADRLCTDGFLIGRQGREVIIGATNERGMLYGVYEYVEKALGIRWVDEPFGEVDTGLRTPGWPEHTVVENPSFSYRGGNMHCCRCDADFCYNADRLGKFRMNNVLLFAYQLDVLNRNVSELRKRGVRITMGGHCWPFFLYDLGRVDPAECLRLHPDWHALVGGERIVCDDSHGQFCLTNEEALDRFLANILEMLEAYHPFIDILSLWPNDTGAAFCECENCAGFSKSDLVLGLINRVADAVTERYPGMQVEMLAYEDFTAPPCRTVPRANVIVNVAGIQRDYRLPMYSAERRNIALFRDLRGWRALREDMPVIVYEYYRLDAIAKSGVIQYELERLHEEGIMGLMDDSFQVNSRGQTQEAVGFMTYLESKLLWNVAQSADSLQRELVTALFGDQAPLVWRVVRRLEQIQASRAQYDLLWHAWRARPLRSLYVQEERLAFITDELADARKRLEHAMPASSEMVRERIARIRDSLDLLWRLMRCTECQMKAQLVLLGGGPQSEAEEWLRRAIEVRCMQPSDISAQAIVPYLTAYDLPEPLVRLLIPVDRKDRVDRVRIMAMRDHICRQIRMEPNGCLRCTMPVCPEMVRVSPLRSFL